MQSSVFVGVSQHGKYETATANAALYIARHVEESGYMSASPSYRPYDPHWFRDSSWAAVSLLRYADYAKASDVSSASAAYRAAQRIADFNIIALSDYLPNIKRGLEARLEERDFFKLDHHMPARIGRDLAPYHDRQMNDRPQLNELKSWLMQHDTVPLILISLREKLERFGLTAAETSFLRQNARTIAEYMGKIYLTPCASEWERDQERLHAYDIAAIYAGFEALKVFSANGAIVMGIEEIEKLRDGLYPGGPLAFLKKHFVRDGILYSSRVPYAQNPDMSEGLDSGDIFIFNNFGITGEMLGDIEIEPRTLGKMMRDRFRGNMLPTRYSGDTYFMGGRWLPNGLAFSEYFSRMGATQKGAFILDYVLGRYHGSFPEQEIVDPESPGNDDGNYCRSNGNMPIQDLQWSYAGVVMASLAQLGFEHNPATQYNWKAEELRRI